MPSRARWKSLNRKQLSWFLWEHLSYYRLKTHYTLRLWHLVPDFSKRLGVWGRGMLFDVTSGTQFGSKSKSPLLHWYLQWAIIHGTMNNIDGSPLIEHYQYISTHTSPLHCRPSLGPPSLRCSNRSWWRTGYEDITIYLTQSITRLNLTIQWLITIKWPHIGAGELK